MAFSIKEKQAFLFDMDGVLYNSMPNHARAWVEAMNRTGISMKTEDVYMQEGCTGPQVIKNMGRERNDLNVTDQMCQDIYRLKSEIFRSMGKVDIMPGALDVFEKIKQAGKTIVIVTGSGQPDMINRLLTDFGAYVTRDMMVTAFEVKRGKPYPDPYLAGLQKAGVGPSQAVVIENAPYGVRAGVAAGIDVIALNTGPLEDRFLLQEGAKILYPSMSAFCQNWDELNK